MKSSTFLLLGFSILFIQCKNGNQEKLLIPKQNNEFVRIYKPGGDYFFGPDTKNRNEGEWYDDWVPNDHDGIYYLVYCSAKSVQLRESRDFIHWSKADTIFISNSFDPESPTLLSFNNSFYLFVCSWDGIWDQKEIVGAYQHKTYVFLSEDPYDFGTETEKQITTLNSHAPEIFQDEEGQWYISSVEWPNRGVSVDRLSWEELK